MLLLNSGYRAIIGKIKGSDFSNNKLLKNAAINVGRVTVDIRRCQMLEHLKLKNFNIIVMRF